jgi:beta-glucosidase
VLKNINKILPLNKSTVTKIAVIGPNADVGNLNCSGSNDVKPPYSISVKKGIETKTGTSKVVYAQGCAINSADTSGFKAARALAAGADYVVFVGGLDATQEGETYDRKSGKVELPGMQQNLINSLASANKNIIVVIHSGGVCAINSSLNNIKGLIYSFYPGQEAGNAVADVLFGDYNPGGRMPVSMPKTTSQLPVWDDDFTNDYGCGYRWFDQNALTPEFAFGSGMSYTTFDYSNLQVSSLSAPAGSPIKISVDVKNTGSVLGDEVVQLYVTNNTTTLWMPKKELKGFKRITLSPGEKQTVSFTLGSEEFYFWNEKTKKYEVSANNYVIKVGGSSDLLPLSANLTLTPSSGKPDLKITQVLTMPRYPLKGQKIVFYALVKNQGNATITPNDKFKVSFYIDNVEVAIADNVSLSIQPGQAVLIESSTAWIAPYSGQFLINATIDKNNSIDEWAESNNDFIKILEVFGDNAITKNLAYKKPVKVSSVQSTTFPGSLAVDGDATTRWSSAYSDPQYLVVDLKNNYKLTKIIVNWESAYAERYQVLISSDSTKWDTVANIITGHAGIETFLTTKSANYIKLNLTKRATAYGYSLFELQAYGDVNTPPVANAGLDLSINLPINNVALDGSASKDADGDVLSYIWEQLSGPLTAVLTNSNTVKLAVTNLITPGTYIFKLTVNDGKEKSGDIVTVIVAGSTVTSLDNMAKQEDVLVYPNPTSDKFFVNLANSKCAQITMCDITGRQLVQKNINKQTDVVEINVAGFAKGLYLLIIQGEDRMIVKKVEIK